MTLLRVDHDEALAVLDPSSGLHRLSETVRFSRTSYVAVPPSWRDLPADQLHTRVGTLLQVLYDERNQQTRRAQPDDPNYIAQVSHIESFIEPEKANLDDAFHLVEVREDGAPRRVPWAQRQTFAAAIRGS